MMTMLRKKPGQEMDGMPHQKKNMKKQKLSRKNHGKATTINRPLQTTRTFVMPRVMAISARTLPGWICTRPNLAFITLPSVRNWGTFLPLPWNLARRIVSYRVGSRITSIRQALHMNRMVPWLERMKLTRSICKFYTCASFDRCTIYSINLL